MGGISPKNKWLAAEKIFSNSITIWDISTKKELKTLPKLKSQVTEVAFSDCNHFIAVACKNKTIVIWEIASGKEVKRLKKEATTLSKALKAHTATPKPQG